MEATHHPTDKNAQFEQGDKVACFVEDGTDKHVVGFVTEVVQDDPAQYFIDVLPGRFSDPDAPGGPIDGPTSAVGPLGEGVNERYAVGRIPGRHA